MGLLHPGKNILGLVAAAAALSHQIPGLRFRLAGPWVDGYEEEVRAARGRHGVSSASFELLGSLTRAQLVEELASCTCVDLPSS